MIYLAPGHDLSDGTTASGVGLRHRARRDHHRPRDRCCGDPGGRRPSWTRPRASSATRSSRGRSSSSGSSSSTSSAPSSWSAGLRGPRTATSGIVPASTESSATCCSPLGALVIAVGFSAAKTRRHRQPRCPRRLRGGRHRDHVRRLPCSRQSRGAPARQPSGSATAATGLVTGMLRPRMRRHGVSATPN